MESSGTRWGFSKGEVSSTETARGREMDHALCRLEHWNTWREVWPGMLPRRWKAVDIAGREAVRERSRDWAQVVPDERIRRGTSMPHPYLLPTLHSTTPTHTPSQVVLLQSTLAAQASEAKRLASAAAALSADIADKQAAIDIDSTTRSIEHARSGSRQEWQYASKGPVVAPEWRGSTTSICAAARQVVAVSARLRGKAAQVVVECARTEAAAKKELLRVHALSINRLRATVAESQQQIAQLDDALAELGRIKASAEAAMAEKEDACAVTTDRLNTRNQRPDRERVHDQAQMALQNELRSLTSAAHELARQIQRYATLHTRATARGRQCPGRGCTPGLQPSPSRVHPQLY